METDTRKAARMLADLLDLPNSRPGSWEAEHVAALDAELGEILDILTDGNQPSITSIDRENDR